MRIGIFGGTFDPPHNGHVLTVAQLRTYVDLLYVIPTWKPKYKNCTSFEHRYKMCELAFEKLDIQLSKIDAEQNFDYTYQTIDYLENLKKYIDNIQITLFVGADWRIKTFKNYEQFSKKCRIISFSRPGFPSKHNSFSVQLEISSSKIREEVKSKSPINGLVPYDVLKYIQHHNLYI